MQQANNDGIAARSEILSMAFYTFRENCSSVHTCHREDRPACAAATRIQQGKAKKSKPTYVGEKTQNQSVVLCFTQM